MTNHTMNLNRHFVLTLDEVLAIAEACCSPGRKDVLHVAIREANDAILSDRDELRRRHRLGPYFEDDLEAPSATV